MSLTRKEYYDLLVKTSKEGGFPSGECLGAFGYQCKYRAPNNKKCAVGIILPDELYSKDCEGINIVALKGSGMLVNYDWVPQGMTINNLREIQSIHDDFAIQMQKEEFKKWPHDRFVDQLNYSTAFYEQV